MRSDPVAIVRGPSSRYPAVVSTKTRALLNRLATDDCVKTSGYCREGVDRQ